MRPTTLLLTAVLMLCSSVATARVDPSAEILRLEQAWSQAVVTHQPNVVAGILADDYVGIDGRGVVTHKSDEIAEAQAVAPAA